MIKRELLSGGQKQTARGIKELIDTCCDDLKMHKIRVGTKHKKMVDMSLEEIYYYVRSIPYKLDEKGSEVISSPRITFKKGLADCKKKSIILCCWAKLHGVPFRLIGSSIRPDKNIHHIFPQFKIGGEWKNVDATYKWFKLFEPKRVTNYVQF